MTQQGDLQVALTKSVINDAIYSFSNKEENILTYNICKFPLAKVLFAQYCKNTKSKTIDIKVANMNVTSFNPEQ